MEIMKAIDVVSQLANGINPTTGEIFSEDSPYNNPEVIRALYAVLNELKNPKKNINLSVAGKQAKNLENGKPRNAGLPWTESIRAEAATLFKQGKSTKELANHFERTEGAIISELEHQGLLVRDESIKNP